LGPKNIFWPFLGAGWMLPDRPPRRGVASDSEIRPTSSRDKLYLDPVAHAPGRPFQRCHPHSALCAPISTTPYCATEQHSRIVQNRHPVRLQDGWLAQSEARRRPVRPSSSGVGLDQPSFVYRTTLNESLFSTSLRSLGGPTLTPALTPPKPARCGPSCPSIRLVLLGYRWRMDDSFRINIPSTAKASQLSVSPQTTSQSRLHLIVAGHGMLGPSTLKPSPHLLCVSAALDGGQRYLGVELTTGRIR
jgi:hypothetical protein